MANTNEIPSKSPYEKAPEVKIKPAFFSDIPGWGSDLSPENRPGVPKERTPPRHVQPHWSKLEQQQPKIKIHLSPEHKQLTPVFGTACPPKLLSGLLRNFAYKYGEARMAHWLTLMLADRIDVAESLLTGLLKLRPDNPISEMGLIAEFKRHGIRSRVGQHRADVRRLRSNLIFAGVVATAVGSLWWFQKNRR